MAARCFINYCDYLVDNEVESLQNLESARFEFFSDEIYTVPQRVRILKHCIESPLQFCMEGQG